MDHGNILGVSPSPMSIRSAQPICVAPSLEGLWTRLGVRLLRFSGSGLERGLQRLDPPRLRSGLGKFARQHLCPEALRQASCPGCTRMSHCAWTELFPGSAKIPGRIAPWILHQAPEGLLVALAAPSPEAFRGFWLALEAALSLACGRDRGTSRTGPRWLEARLVDPLRGEDLALAWGGRDLPMSAAPPPLQPGDELVFEAPLELRTGEEEAPPEMGDWLRLGRNRLAELASQAGRPVWEPRDPRWRELSALAVEARWTWIEAESGRGWAQIPRHGFEARGWRGRVRIEALPEPWRAWASLLPFLGAGSHTVFGCGTARVERREEDLLPLPAPEPEASGNLAAPVAGRRIVLNWKDGIA